MNEDLLQRKVEEYLRSMPKERKIRSFALTDKTIKAIEIMKILQSRMYYVSTGMEKRISASDIVNYSVQKLTDFTLEQIRQVQKKKKVSPTG